MEKRTSWLIGKASRAPPFIMAAMPHPLFSSAVKDLGSGVALMTPRVSFLTSLVDFSMVEAWRVRR